MTATPKPGTPWKLDNHLSQGSRPDGAKFFNKTWTIEEGIEISVEAPTEDVAISWAQAICAMHNAMPDQLAERLVELRVACWTARDQRKYAEENLQKELAKKNEVVAKETSALEARVKVLEEALTGLIAQIDGIGIADWHGAEGLDLAAARAALNRKDHHA